MELYLSLAEKIRSHYGIELSKDDIYNLLRDGNIPDGVSEKIEDLIEKQNAIFGSSITYIKKEVPLDSSGKRDGVEVTAATYDEDKIKRNTRYSHGAKVEEQLYTYNEKTGKWVVD